MDAKVAKKWVAALKSGEYEQGQRFLVNKEVDVDGTPYLAYCCLGVLCDLYAKSEKISRKELENVFMYNETDDTCDRALLPIVVLEWAGMKTDAGEFESVIAVNNNTGQEAGNLADLNDGGADFDGIAGVIEEYAEQL